MKVEAALQGVSRLYLDTAPVIYYVQEAADQLQIVNVIFQRIEADDLRAIASPVTLAECLVVPLRLGNVVLQQSFLELLTNTEGIDFVAIGAAVGQRAAALRVRHGLKLPDALQIATAIGSNCDAFLTNDAELKRVTELRVLVIKELEV